MNAHPTDHPLRRTLVDELHARPYEPLATPERVTSIAVLTDEKARARELAHVAALCRHFGAAPPAAETIHFTTRLGAELRLKWERHGEFTSYTLFMPGRSPRPFSEPASSFVPEEWLKTIPGETLHAAHAKLIAEGSEPMDPARIAEHFDGNVFVGGEIGDGAGAAYTDFRTYADGFGRFLVLDRSLTPRQAGRMLLRLFELDAYRMMALLALPVARELAPRIHALERGLAALTQHIGRSDGTDEKLLAQLTGLAAEVESALVASQFRFGASRAYYDIVRSRTLELRERRVAGIQPIEEFINRRVGPAMATCASVSRQMRELSDRVAQASSLLSTRVEIARERQNQALLASMDRRAHLQLRLQQTVEGLSVAAISYYIVGLVGYLAKALKATGLRIEPEITAGVAIPFVVAAVAVAMRRTRRKLTERSASATTTSGDAPEN